MSLKKAGESFRGLCPFHKEKTPSFIVEPEKSVFHCLTCGASGSVIEFVMKVERIVFVDALSHFAKELNIAIPDPDDPMPSSKQQLLLRLHEFALGWFRENLAARRNAKANEALVAVCIPPELVDVFRLGSAASTRSSISAIFSSLSCLGVWWISKTVKQRLQ